MADRRRAQPPVARSVGAPFEVVSGSVEETQALGERLGRALRAGDVVALRGALGSGKTTLIQGIARGLGRASQTLKSPTFVLVREYPGSVPLIHVDGYRLEGASAAAWLDLDLLFSPAKVTLIEWAERFEGLLPEGVVEVHLEHVSAHRRRLRLPAANARAAELINRLGQADADPTPTRDPSPEDSSDEVPGH